MNEWLMEREMNGWKNGEIYDTWMDGCVNEQMDGQMHGKIYEWMDEWLYGQRNYCNRQVGGQMDEQKVRLMD